MTGEASGATTVRFLQEENQRLLERAEELQEENSYLRECLKSMRGILWAASHLDARVELQRLLDRIIYEVLRMVDAEDGSLSLIDEETQELVFAVVRGTLQEQLQGYRMPMDTGIAGWVAKHREAVSVDDIAQEPRFSSLVDQAFQFRTQSLASVPLVSRGRVLGVIEVVNKFSGRPFDERDLEMLSISASIAAMAIDLASIEEQA